MKVLFAVNDENISASIVKKYQKEYKEIISYKNVYYFNAILKELQRNKSYDRIIISEDLEEFTSSSYEQKDKFIFDKLDNISDEAVSTDGKDIPIILICSERRSKAEEILVKLFGISVYNAVIGEDRSIDEVCRLINKPRSKKEAKLYYKIDSENVNYQKGKENDVREEELQNILMHFKKLGRNETRYVESFNNIVSQYNDEQLKVIIAVLPNMVKEILRENSPEYQRIVYQNEIPEKMNESVEDNTSKTMNKRIKSTPAQNSGKLLKLEAKDRMSKPVVVPTTLENNIYKKVEPKKELGLDLEDLEDEYEDDDEDLVQPIIEEETPKRRGRPRKNPIPENVEQKNEAPKKRGRPRKNPVVQEIEEPEDEQELDEDNIYENDDNTTEIEVPPTAKFNNIIENEEEQDDADILPGFSYDEDEDENENSDVKDEENIQNPFVQKFPKKEEKQEVLEEQDDNFDDDFDNLLIGEKKVVAFVGTSKNGTSFMVNNIAQILSEMRINTAILDTTKNRNAYYIYTKNDEELRNIAVKSMESLIDGNPKGIQVNNNLTVYTGLPSQYDDIKNVHPILENLVLKHSVVLIDCDFDTPIEYFNKCQELYLVQTMDVLTIQPLTEFLRDLKIKNVLDENKIRIILNKILRVKGITGKNIIGGMSNYNDPEMSFMTELFNRNIVRISATIPFDEDVYAKYLESLVECEIKINGYPKDFRQRLNELAIAVYPLLTNNVPNKKMKKDKKQPQYVSSFSSDMNNTLNDMRRRY